MSRSYEHALEDVSKRGVYVYMKNTYTFTYAYTYDKYHQEDIYTQFRACSRTNEDQQTGPLPGSHAPCQPSPGIGNIWTKASPVEAHSAHV